MADLIEGLFYDELDSTMDEASRIISLSGNLKEAYFIQTRVQSKARGRRGREWRSLAGNFQTSYCLPLFREDPPITTLPFICGLAVFDIIKTYVRSDDALSMKWPNDILIYGKKAGGLLIEKATGKQDNEWAILGIGLNTICYPTDVSNEATSILEYSGQLIRSEVLAVKIQKSLRRRLDSWRKGDVKGQLDEWILHAHHLNKRVRVVKENNEGSSTLEGCFEGIDLNGALLLKRDDGECEKLTSADVYFNLRSI